MIQALCRAFRSNPGTMGGMTSGTAKLALAAQFSPTVNRLKTMGISPAADADHRVSLIGIAVSYRLCFFRFSFTDLPSLFKYKFSQTITFRPITQLLTLSLCLSSVDQSKHHLNHHGPGRRGPGVGQANNRLRLRTRDGQWNGCTRWASQSCTRS